ncbi:MAG: SH3 domain-containing protein [Roseiflexus sp.]|nr:SH3 domain-containing protein [Roseiflexus sp.]MCS7288009.1 SH3 domain-containing protein [Roseiflexus sp.]MDW8148039.1 SH3 domain-containing protein [Roseiflexaceae bacterium]MDW8232930.1 SH3 domain-containing protein [Roseiflexaceae bacterium]
MHLRLVVLILSVTLLGGVAIPAPVAEPVLAQTIVPVTPTSAPGGAPRPTGTPLSPLAQETERLLSSALERTSQASAYRMAVSVRAAGTVAGARSAREEMLIEYSGEYNGANFAFVLRSPELLRQGIDPTTGITAVRANGVTYAVGPLPLHGATDRVWYTIGSDVPSFLTPPYRLEDILRRLGDALPLAEMSRGRTEMIDGQRCTAYQSGADAAPAALRALGRPLVPPRATSANTPLDLNIQRGVVQLWLCGDGMVRRVQVTAAGNVRRQPSNVFSVAFRVDITNLNGRVKITAPAQTRALQRAPEPTVVAVRAGPIQSAPGAGSILGQVNVQDAVIIIERSADQRWYRVRAPAATGWVSASLLSVSPTVARQVPVASS